MKYYLKSKIEDVIEYVLKVKKGSNTTKYSLCRSNNASWTAPGSTAASIVNHGNGLIIKLDKDIELDLDYDVVGNLYAILDSVVKLEDNMLIPLEMLEAKTVKKKDK